MAPRLLSLSLSLAALSCDALVLTMRAPNAATRSANAQMLFGGGGGGEGGGGGMNMMETSEQKR